MRPKVVTVSLIVLLGVLVGGVAWRGTRAHQTPPAPAVAPDASASASAQPSGDASNGAPTASATASARAPAKPSLARPLRVTALGWELVAPLVMANGGLGAKKSSVLGKRDVALTFSAHSDGAKVENALARGGDDEQGADLAIMPLPRFVASYERLKALSPVIVLVAGWSEGGELVLSTQASFDDLPAQGDVSMRGRAGEAASFLGLFALDLAGVPPSRVKLEETAGKPAWSALARREARAASGQMSGNVLLSTAEASRLVPFVAVVQAGMLDKHADVLTVLVESWFSGHKLVAQSPSDTARAIAEDKTAPEPLELLTRLGEIAPASLADNAHALGLAGRGAVTLEALFVRAWSLWRDAKVLTIPPEKAPVDGRIVAALVRAGGDLTPPPQPGDAGKRQARSDGRPLIVYRAPRGKLDEAQLVDTLGFLAGAFPRSPLELTTHAGDPKLAQKVIDRAVERFALSSERVTKGKAAPRGAAAASIEVMPVP
jgi:hypothetical protein